MKKNTNVSDLFLYVSYLIVGGMGIFAAICIGGLFVNLVNSILS